MNDMTAQELANALAAVLRPQAPLSSDQQRVVLQYRLIRNGLGNYGGHGDASGDIALIRLTQSVRHDHIWLAFKDPLPRTAARLEAYSDDSPEQIDTIPISNPKVRGVSVFEGKGALPSIVRVVVLDPDGTPIAAGVPSQDPAPHVPTFS